MGETQIKCPEMVVVVKYSSECILLIKGGWEAGKEDSKDTLRRNVHSNRQTVPIENNRILRLLLTHPPTHSGHSISTEQSIWYYYVYFSALELISLTLVHSLAEKVATWRTCVNNTQRTLAYPLPMAMYGGHRRYNSPLNRYDISRLHWNIYQGTWMWLYNEMRGWNIILLDVLAILIIFTFCWELGI